MNAKISKDTLEKYVPETLDPSKIDNMVHRRMKHFFKWNTKLKKQIQKSLENTEV